MQDEKKKQLIEIIGKKLSDERKSKSKSLTTFCYEYSLSTSSLNSIERGLRDVQICTLWDVLTAHGIKLSAFFKEIEDELPADFYNLEE